MNIGYCNHHCNKGAILVYTNMAFDAFHFFIAVNSVQRLVIAPFNALAIYICLHWVPCFDSALPGHDHVICQEANRKRREKPISGNSNKLIPIWGTLWEAYATGNPFLLNKIWYSKSYFRFLVCRFSTFVIYCHSLSVKSVRYIFIISLLTSNKDIIGQVRKPS